MIDLTMWRRADGQTVEEATAGESAYIVVSYRPVGAIVPRVLVLRWPLLVTVCAVLGFYFGIALIGGAR